MRSAVSPRLACWATTVPARAPEPAAEAHIRLGLPTQQKTQITEVASNVIGAPFSPFFFVIQDMKELYEEATADVFKDMDVQAPSGGRLGMNVLYTLFSLSLSSFLRHDMKEFHEKLMATLA